MRLKDMREDSDMTQKQIADILHIRQSTYCQYENGQRQVPIAVLIELARIYKTSVDFLIGITDQRTPYPSNK